jgi:ketose-bisphosphate aldolase
MPLVPSIELINDAYRRKYAVPSFCTWDAESVKTVLDVAGELSAPVLIMNGWAEFPIIKPFLYSHIVRGLISRYTIPAALHLDHGQSLEEVRSCIDARYTSVMLDYSGRSFEENIRALKEVSRLAHPHGITVEGELGAVGKTDSHALEGFHRSTLTDPEDASIYVRETDIDMLAVSIGNAHGLYHEKPELNFDLLEQIKRAVPVPLVLHGGSGTPQDDLDHAISLGIAKINVASELMHTVRTSLFEAWSRNEHLWIPLALEHAYGKMAEVVRKWLVRTRAAGKA